MELRGGIAPRKNCARADRDGAVLVADVQRRRLAEVEGQGVRPAVEVGQRLPQREPRVEHELAALADAPHLDRLVGRRRDEEALAVRERRHRAAVGAQRLHARLLRVAQRRVPHADRAVGAAGEEEAALEAEALRLDEQHAAHAARVRVEEEGLGVGRALRAAVLPPRPVREVAVGEAGDQRAALRLVPVAGDRGAGVGGGLEGAPGEELHAVPGVEGSLLLFAELEAGRSGPEIRKSSTSRFGRRGSRISSPSAVVHFVSVAAVSVTARSTAQLSPACCLRACRSRSRRRRRCCSACASR